MNKKSEPDPTPASEDVFRVRVRDPLVVDSESFPSTVRWRVPEHLKEKREAEQIITALTERDHKRAEDQLKLLVILLLAGLAFAALLIVLLLGFGIITLPTAFVLAVITPLLSGVLTVLISLGRNLF